MRKLVQLRTVSENNEATDMWIRHLVNTIIIKQLELPHELQAKLLHETFHLKNK
ncbi:hypothetical protein QNH47_12720 [Virgibacillus halodenitrificans]|uniref:hypothetical protein n=1 Tax=Virgibacillus halodenitrificans TaxID=1482 RepID=UPI0024BF2F3B|nr:hypothetical protein [Virgibacillus halodenitrificans]WHX25030.1 hypothetical protein QNH47_12720 [Virgibacillus halodenitrificans]